VKWEEYNPKAKEALGKIFIDIGVAIFKGIILLFTVVPVTVILKSVLDKEDKPFSLLSAVASMTFGTYILLVFFVVFSMMAGAHMRDKGLKYIHEAEEELKNNS